MANGSLMKVESIAECSMEHSAILLTCIKRQLVLKTIFFCLFESGRFKQVVLYKETHDCMLRCLDTNVDTMNVTMMTSFNPVNSRNPMNGCFGKQ